MSDSVLPVRSFDADSQRLARPHISSPNHQEDADESTTAHDDGSISEPDRIVLSERIEARRGDAAFRARLRRLLVENRHALKRLAP